MAYSEIILPGYDFRQWDIRNKAMDHQLLTDSEYMDIVHDTLSFLGTSQLKNGFTEDNKAYKYVCIKYQFRPPIETLNNALKLIDLYKNA